MRVLFAARQSNLFERYAFPHFTVSEDYRTIDALLSEPDLVLELAKDIPAAATGRNRVPVEITLRLIVLKHLKGLSYRDLEQTLKENLADRWLCKLNDQSYTFKTIQNQLVMVGEERMKAINDRIIALAKNRKLTRGRKLRVDSTVVSANLHYPTDSSLIVDAIRVIHRVVKQELKTIPEGYRSFRRKIKQQVNILRSLGRKNQEIKAKAVKTLTEIGRKISRQARTIANVLVQEQRAMLDRVVEQAGTVLQGLKPKNRIVSIFETEARPLPKGKAGKICEFGHEVQVQETDGNLIANWEINNTPSDTAFFPRALAKHEELFNQAPTEAETDRGYWSPENYELCQTYGVKRINLPKKGNLNEEEQERQKTRAFKRGQCWRAGSEAKISWLKRRFGWDRCRYKGRGGIGRWVGFGAVACNLLQIARLCRSG